MKLLSGPYGTVLEFSQGTSVGPLANMQEKFNSKRGSFYPALIPEGQKALCTIARQYCEASIDILVTPSYRGGVLYKRDHEDNEICGIRSSYISHKIKKIADAYKKELRGSIGPIGDAYTAVGSPTNIQEAIRKHERHIEGLLHAKVDAILFETAVKKEEILGVLKICEKHKVPCNTSFYINEGGYIPDPDGQMTLDDMIAYIDANSTYENKKYGINCAEKKSIIKACNASLSAKDKIHILYPNASHHTACSYNTAHQEGEDLFTFIQNIQKILPKLDTVGGCCGYTPTDIKHLRECLQKK